LYDFKGNISIKEWGSMAIITRDQNRQAKLNRSLTNYSRVWSMMDDLLRFPRLWEENFGITNQMADIWEENNNVFVKVPIPGIHPKDLDISITGDTLTIRGEAKQEEEDKKRNYHQRQISYGEITYSYTLPTIVDSNKAEASSDKGMLTIKLPKSEESKPKQIKVNIK
jgi:HSP20 family protein